MAQRTTKTRRAKSARKAAGGANLPGKSFIELITVQWQRERADLDLSNFLLAIYLMRLGTMIERDFDRLCQQRYRVSGSDMRVLFALRRGGPPYVKRPTDLFKALLVTSGAMTKKVDRLATLGMVERVQDPGHLGGFLIRLTKKGFRVAETRSLRSRFSSVRMISSCSSTVRRRASGEDMRSAMKGSPRTHNRCTSSRMMRWGERAKMLKWKSRFLRMSGVHSAAAACLRIS